VPVDIRAELPEGAQKAPENVQRAIAAKQKEFHRKVLDRVVSDPDFKDRLLDNPKEALQEAGLADELSELRDGGDEVSGHWSSWVDWCYDYTTWDEWVHYY
jgi:hypothetical protein